MSGYRDRTWTNDCTSESNPPCFAEEQGIHLETGFETSCIQNLGIAGVAEVTVKVGFVDTCQRFASASNHHKTNPFRMGNLN